MPELGPKPFCFDNKVTMTGQSGPFDDDHEMRNLVLEAGEIGLAEVRGVCFVVSSKSGELYFPIPPNVQQLFDGKHLFPTFRKVATLQDRVIRMGMDGTAMDLLLDLMETRS